MSHNTKTTQKPTTVRPHISVNNGWMGTFEVPILYDSFNLGSAVPGEASETMVELCLWAIYRTYSKLAILRLSLVHSTCNEILCTTATLSLFRLNPTVAAVAEQVLWGSMLFHKTP